MAAYQQKAAAVDDIEAGLMQEAQKFFVLTQTDNLWKEHLQVRWCSWTTISSCTVACCLACPRVAAIAFACGHVPCM